MEGEEDPISLPAAKESEEKFDANDDENWDADNMSGENDDDDYVVEEEGRKERVPAKSYTCPMCGLLAQRFQGFYLLDEEQHSVQSALYLCSTCNQRVRRVMFLINHNKIRKWDDMSAKTGITTSYLAQRFGILEEFKDNPALLIQRVITSRKAAPGDSTSTPAATSSRPAARGRRASGRRGRGRRGRGAGRGRGRGRASAIEKPEGTRSKPVQRRRQTEARPCADLTLKEPRQPKDGVEAFLEAARAEEIADLEERRRRKVSLVERRQAIRRLQREAPNGTREGDQEGSESLRKEIEAARKEVRMAIDGR